MGTVFRESGYLGRLTSLGGVKGHEGIGRQVEDASALSVTSLYCAIPANPSRVWASITNDPTSTNDLDIYLGDGLYKFCSLVPGGSLLINDELPWTGNIWVNSTAAEMLAYECCLAGV